MFICEKVEVCFPYDLGRIAYAESMSLSFAHFDKPAFKIFEIDIVRYVIHKRIEQVPFINKRLLGMFLFGNISGDAEGTDDFPVGIIKRNLGR